MADLKSVLRKLSALEWVFWLSGFIIIGASLLLNIGMVNRVLLFIIGLLLTVLVWA
ncbi:hypothetical protein HYS54_00730 [Candidatus Micrarchaeota archaeon]|nr:hypothetical protein [Candidatus Micrarchaeota archaeon]